MNRWLDTLGDIPQAPLRIALLRRAVGLFGLLLMAATWRLWTPQTVFPQVPLATWAIDLPTWFHWLTAIGMVAGFAGMLAAPSGRAARGALIVLAISTIALVVLDQERLQPWVYQFLILAIVLAACPPRPALALLRLFVVSFYFHSAVTKLDYSFLHTFGQQFLVALLGSGVETWSDSTRLALATLFPLGELAVAVGLLFARTRPFALVAAVVLHLLLLAILGPWGLNHRPGVLIWNVYFIVQNLLLFAGHRTSSQPVEASTGSEPAAVERAPWPVLAAMLAVITLPLLESTAWFDIWPSWGLYASSSERVVFQVHRLGRQQLPDALQPFVEVPDDPADPWLTVRLDRWALDALGAPIYPQNRFQLGVAAAVTEQARLAQRARAIRLALADRSSGARQHTIVQGAAQFDAAASEYHFNARPNSNWHP